MEKLEEKVWDPSSSLTEKQIDQFLVVARYVHAVVQMVKLMKQSGSIALVWTCHTHRFPHSSRWAVRGFS